MQIHAQVAALRAAATVAANVVPVARSALSGFTSACFALCVYWPHCFESFAAFSASSLATAALAAALSA